MEIILASASPRRADLLRQIGVEFSICVSDMMEIADNNLPIRERIMKLALEKAINVAKRFSEGIILGADTVVVCDDLILGKPKDREDAKEMLQKLSGRTHQVMTAVALVDAATGQEWQNVQVSEVVFRAMTEQDIEAYLRTGEYIDKAGAYGIQGFGALLVEKISGCYYNIVGLPLKMTADGLKEMGVDLYCYGHRIQ